jgi:hypothetical protein
MLVDRYASETYRLAAAIVGMDDAADVTQETFVAAWSCETQGVSPTVDDTNPITSSLVQLDMLSQAPTIEAPDVEAPPDAEALGLPPDFPLGEGDNPG